MDKVNQILKKIGGIVHEYVISEDNRIIGGIVIVVILFVIVLAII